MVQKWRDTRNLLIHAFIPKLELLVQLLKKAKSVEELQTAFDNTPAPALNMLNTKYVIYNPEAPPIDQSRMHLEMHGLLKNLLWLKMPIRRFHQLNHLILQKRQLSIIPLRIRSQNHLIPVLENEKIELVSYQPDELIYKYSAREEKLAVFSEIYYPAGWKSYIDGKESKYFRTDYVLRGMVVPAGDHEIKFTFKPASYIYWK